MHHVMKSQSNWYLQSNSSWTMGYQEIPTLRSANKELKPKGAVILMLLFMLRNKLIEICASYL